MSKTFGDPGAPETDYRYPFLQDVGYVGGGGTPSESCECKFACYPDFRARYESIYGNFSKVGHEEFGDPSTPPRFFKRKRTTYQCYVAGLPTETFWEQHDYNIDDPGSSVTTYSDPAFTACTGADEEVLLETPTFRRTTWTTGGGGEVSNRLEIIEVLSNEFTTEELINKVMDELPAWAPDDVDWPGDNEPGSPGTAYYVQSGICYQKGNALWEPGSSRLVVPSVWRLSEDEVDFFCQRVRFRIVPPHSVGPSSFTIEWKEEFLPDGGSLETPTNADTFSGTEADAESDTREITLREGENGENFLCAARFIP